MKLERRSATLSSDGVLTITIYEPIGGWFYGVTARWIRSQIEAAGGVRRINVFINSPGGESFEGVAIYNELRASAARVTVYVRGLCASAASLVAMAGNRIVVEPGSLMMIHEAAGGVFGSAKDMQAYAALLEKINGQYAEIYATRSGKPTAQMLELMAAETWLTGAEAVALGLADSATEMAPAPDGEPVPDPGPDQVDDGEDGEDVPTPNPEDAVRRWMEPSRYGIRNVPEALRGLFLPETRVAIEEIERRRMETRELHTFDAVELRADTDGKLRGYAAVFDSETEIRSGEFEVVRPGAFRDTLGAAQNIFAFWNHDSNIVLGSTENGTLRLWEDERGLAFELTPPDSAEGQSKAESVRRGDVKRMSFAFSPVKQERRTRSGGGTLRELHAVKLWEVSPVPFPAYPDTQVGTRSKQSLEVEQPANGGLDPRLARLRLAEAKLKLGGTSR